MKKVLKYDIIVIGTGPAGEAAAMNAAKHDRKVAVISDRPQVGGSCTHLGTIPSKALRHSVKEVMEFNNNPLFRELGDARTLTFQQIIKHADRAIYEQVRLRTNFYERNDIDVHEGIAKFIDKHSIKISPKGP